MRWLAALLLIANVSLYLYFSTNERDRRLLNDTAPSAVNEQSMLLRHEVISVQKELQAQSCYRIGPLEYQGRVDVLREFMAKLQLKYTQMSSSGRNVFYYDLLVPDLQQRQKVREIMTVSNNSGLEEYVVASYFSYKLATKMRQQMQDAGITATLRKRQASLDVGQRYWFDVVLVDDEKLQSLLVFLKSLSIEPQEVRCEFVT